MLLTARRRRKILIITYLIMTVCVLSFIIKSFSVQKVIRTYNEKIINTERALKEEEAKLNKLENELEQVDSLAYIEKIAEDRLGLVHSDVIVIKKKPSTEQAE